jgi:hypothetical protein
MTSLRQRMIRDMNLAGFTAGTQRAYIHGVHQLAKHYRLPPDQLSEKQVEDYVFYLRDDKKVAKGTFHTNHRFKLRFTACLPCGKTRYFCENDRAIANKNPYQEYFHSIRFLFVNTLNRDWALFTKKKCVSRVRSVCLTLAAAKTVAL